MLEMLLITYAFICVVICAVNARSSDDAKITQLNVAKLELELEILRKRLALFDDEEKEEEWQ